MFASRWRKDIKFVPGWVTNSEVVRAWAERPEGPYVYQETVLPARGAEHWDGMMTTNPAACVEPDDSILLAYKAVAHAGDLLQYRRARAASWEARFERELDGPICDFSATGDHIEDAYLWRSPEPDGGYEMIFKAIERSLSDVRVLVPSPASRRGEPESEGHWDFPLKSSLFSCINGPLVKALSQSKFTRPQIVMLIR